MKFSIKVSLATVNKSCEFVHILWRKRNGKLFVKKSSMGNFIFCTILMETRFKDANLQRYKDRHLRQLSAHFWNWSNSGINYWLQDSRISASILLRFALRFSINSTQTQIFRLVKVFILLCLLFPLVEASFFFLLFGYNYLSIQINLQYQEKGSRGTCVLNGHESLRIFPKFQINNAALL